MKGFTTLAAIFLVSISAHAQRTAAEIEQRRETITPDARSWSLSPGAFYMNLNLDFSEIEFEDQPIGGGFLAAEHQFHPAFSGEFSVSATWDASTSTRQQGLLVSGDDFSASVHVHAIIIGLAGKFFPLRLPLFNLHNSRIQPYIIGGAGAAIVPLELRGTYNVAGESSAVELDLNETFGLWSVGAGADFYFTRRFGAFADAQWLSSFAEPGFRIDFTPTGTGRRERLDMDALQVRVGLKFIF